MVIFGSILLVILITLGFYIKNPREYKWWEFVIPLVITVTLAFGSKFLMESISTRFVEYWGETITSIYEEEPWNEWVHKTCSETYPCGSDSHGNTQYCTRYYDCSYRDDHGPDWYCEVQSGKSYFMSEHMYDSLRVVFGDKPEIVEIHKNYDPNVNAYYSAGTKFEGTTVGKASAVYKVRWPGTDSTRKGVFTKHRYVNRIKSSDLSVFNISVVTQEEADSMGLYQYPKTVDKYNFPTILGKNIPPDIEELFKKLNAKYGASNQLRLWILVFDDKPAITAKYQQNYWVNGNKNELVVCIGRKGNQIQWAYSFSWALSSELTAAAASKVLELYEYNVKGPDGKNQSFVLPIGYFKKEVSKVSGLDTSMIPNGLILPFPKASIKKITRSPEPVLTEATWRVYYNYLNQNLGKFQRREFKEFSYLKSKPKTWQIIVVYIIALISAIVTNIWVSNNEIKDEN